MIFYPSWLPVDGITIAPWLTLINKRCYLDGTLHEHERVHADQQRKLGTLKFWFKYLSDDSFRYEMELEACRAQIAVGGDVRTVAWNLATNYGLGIPVDKVTLDLIKNV